MSRRALAARVLPPVALALAAGLLLSRLITIALADRSGLPVGTDVELYLDAAQRWLGGGPFYHAYQVSGPYTIQIQNGAILYPPPILVLLVPFTVLPLALWWIVPIGIIGWVVWRLRPSMLGWAGIGAALAAPATIGTLVNGNPVIWATAALALGTLYAWPAAFAAIKLSIAPFALFGCWHRSWWLAAGTGLLVSLAFLPMWPDYVRVLLNSSHPRGLLYSIAEVPLVMLPLIAWLTRAQQPSASCSGEGRGTGRGSWGIVAPAPRRRWRSGEVLPADGTIRGSARGTRRGDNWTGGRAIAQRSARRWPNRGSGRADRPTRGPSVHPFLADIDPASGSLIIQALIAMALAIPFFMRDQISRLVRSLRRVKPRDPAA